MALDRLRTVYQKCHPRGEGEMSSISEEDRAVYALKPIRFDLLSRFEWVTIPLFKATLNVWCST